MRFSLRSAVAGVVVALSIAACGDDDIPPPGTDAGDTRDAGTADLGGRDAALRCTSDADCSDALFCNGDEQCLPASPTADVRGCVAGAPPCPAGGSCSEDTNVCAACTTIDADGDGVSQCDSDCDDTDASRFPGNDEVCNDRDEDCNDSTFGVRDVDGDGSVDARCCNGATCGDDCDDSLADVHPGESEACDGVDNDCDATIDEGLARVIYRDADLDMYGDDADTMTGVVCTTPAGYSDVGGDCDDADPTRHPGLPEVCDTLDNDCNGLVDDMTAPVPWYVDVDLDGYGDSTQPAITSCAPIAGRVTNAGDCEDTAAGRNPAAPEVCDGVDNDCDTTIDEGVLLTVYRDADGDSFGNPAGPTATACAPPFGFVANRTDCDDTLAARNPSAPEVCDGLDNDCDIGIDEGVTITFYRDADGDGFGNAAGPVASACTTPGGYAANSTDCDDTNASRNPGAPEVCDRVDNDCDGMVDDGVLLTYYRDADGDGFGNVAAPTMMACSAPPGYVVNATDCDDTLMGRNPSASEVCDGVDNDCDGFADEGVLVTFYRDADGDGFGSASAPTVSACTAPAGYALTSTDCDDTLASRNPGAPEVCDGVDNDCDAAIDEGVRLTFYRDADGDGFGALASGTTMACSAPPGYSANSTDCDDTWGAVNFSTSEFCDGIDNNCNGSIDEAGARAFYRDLDLDTFGDNAVRMETMSCTAPTGYVANNTDCNDMVTAVHPGAPELCNGRDDNCSLPGGLAGGVDLAEDGDGDGHSPLGTMACAGGTYPRDDCDDARPTVYAGAPELCDGRDTDCSSGGGGLLAEDADLDGYTSPAATCTGGPYPKNDCNDANATIHAGALELCDRLDNDCSSGGGTEPLEDADSDGHAPSTLACAGGRLHEFT